MPSVTFPHLHFPFFCTNNRQVNFPQQWKRTVCVCVVFLPICGGTRKNSSPMPTRADYYFALIGLSSTTARKCATETNTAPHTQARVHTLANWLKGSASDASVAMASLTWLAVGQAHYCPVLPVRCFPGGKHWTESVGVL